MKTNHCICIDGGTSNTRASLWNGSRQELAAAQREIGVRNTSIDGNNNALKEAVSQCLEEVLRKGALAWEDVGCIMAAGMITSNLGLYEVPHLTAPAGLEDFAAGVKTVSLPDIAPLPVHFVPGMRNIDVPVPREKLPQMDIMRGEEVETLALLEQLPKNTGCVLILPGSHTKFVFVDQRQRITGCMTTLSGEMLSLLTQQSILADTVGSRFAEANTLDEAYLIRGYRVAEAYGLARAAFSCRIEGLFSDSSTDQMASFLMGAVLQQDLLALCRHLEKESAADPYLFVAGKPSLRQALYTLLVKERKFGQVQELAQREELSAKGCMAVAETKALFPFDTP